MTTKKRPPATTAGGPPTNTQGQNETRHGMLPPDDNTRCRWRLRECVKVPGQPVGKGRPRFSMAGGRVRTYTPKRTKEFEQRIAWFVAVRPATGPIKIEITAIFSRPKAMHRKRDPDGLTWHDKKPDLDNVCKAVIDSLNGRAYVDDSQIVRIDAAAFYAEKTGKPRTEITIYERQPTNTEQDTTSNAPNMAPGTTGFDT